LTTSATTMRFNHDSQLLALASKTNKDQLKLVCFLPFVFALTSTDLSAIRPYRFISHHVQSSRIGQHSKLRSITSPASTSRNEVNGSPSGINVEKYYCTRSNSLREGRRADLDGDYKVLVEGGRCKDLRACAIRVEEKRKKRYRAKNKKSSLASFSRSCERRWR